MAKQQRRKKYAFGSPVIEDPSVALTNNQIAHAKAQVKASKDPLAQGLGMFGNLAMSVGQGLMSQGMAAGQGADGKGVAGILNKNQGALDAMFGVLGGSSMGSFALGGTVKKSKRLKYATGGVPIEAEGNEIIQIPGGEPVELDGASHANGGMDLTVPEGTEIYSQQLKGPDGKTMAQRKKYREGRVAKVNKTLSEAPSDKLLRNALARTKQGNAVVDAQDMNKMKMAQLMAQMGQSFAMGGIVPDPEELALAQQQLVAPEPTTYYNNNPIGGALNYNQDVSSTDTTGVTPTPTTTSWMDKLTGAGNMLGDATSNITAGDALGLYGQYKASTDPLKNTRAQRATDVANKNAYRDFGKAGLNELDKAKGFLGGQRASAMKDIQLDQVSSASRNRAGARGINTLRALGIATDTQAQKAKDSVNNQFNAMMAGMFEKAAGMQTQRDQAVMSGEERRLAADAADKDAYYAAMAKDIATRNTGTQHIGKNINEMKTRKVTGELMNRLSSNFDVDPMTGKVTKGGITIGNVGDFEMVKGELVDKRTKKQVK